MQRSDNIPCECCEYRVLTAGTAVCFVTLTNPIPCRTFGIGIDAVRVNGVWSCAGAGEITVLVRTCHIPRSALAVVK
jgi:hypothetical protein